MNISTSNLNNDLDDLIPSFKLKGMNLSLARIENAINKMGNPCKNIPAIQIAGTNGKGSIACFLENCLVKAGIKTGCTTSPHLINWCERIRVNGEMITDKELREAIFSINSLIKGDELTPFELLIASAFHHFSSKDVELMVLEVGLGGRLDATTIHPNRPIIAMASISKDHCEHLGKSLTEIAQEKSAVITKGSTIISAKQNSEVKKVLEKAVKKNNAKITWVKPLSKNWKLGLKGNIQRENAAVAKAALESLKSFGWVINNDQIKKGLASASWPGRLQKTNWENLPLLVDGAHNPDAIKQLSKERLTWEDEDKGVTWIIGIQKNKDSQTMLRYLLKAKDLAWIIPIPYHESWDKQSIANNCPELSHQLYESEGLIEVLKHLRSKGEWPKPPPVITGSLYLIGDLFKKTINPFKSSKRSF
ncbi:bifunctional folylpolyglutamate synthase/dihydrofolate synthase [Prochlorococcus marinus]|uniref:bifunctional folylpolyglutamate synthase/dihydrofolate synthase n=1 Tax=Prochlorococcus marinus TaxID=1219 RepID=UPI0022B43F2C|nr:Mur ligase family protein [Prochlorococcus marinus]